MQEEVRRRLYGPWILMVYAAVVGFCSDEFAPSIICLSRTDLYGAAVSSAMIAASGYSLGKQV